MHNIRIWERRYNALQPARTLGNTRTYSDGHLRRLLAISTLYHAGHKVSNVCRMTETELNNQLLDITQAEESGIPNEFYIAVLIQHTLNYDEFAVNTVINECLTRFSVIETYKSIIYPLLKRVGLLWLNATLCPSQEHFLSAIIRQKLFAAIDRCEKREFSSQHHWLLFLPFDESHDIGLLLASLLLRQAGAHVTYLGSEVPMTALSSAVSSLNPDKLMCFMTRIRPLRDAQDYISRLSEAFPDTDICISGNQKVLADIDYPSRFKWINQLEDFQDILKSEES